MIDFLLRIARAGVKHGGDLALVVVDPTGIAVANYLGKVAADVMREIRVDRKEDQLRADILAAAHLTFEQAKQQGIEAAKAATDDPELQGHIEKLVTLVPASIRASLRRPDDPSGTTLPLNYEVHDAEDIVKILPKRLSRFKNGDTPAFLRGWRLVEQIGAGGFGEVWKAQKINASSLVAAIKFGHGLSETELSLLNEGEVLNRLQAEGGHDGIVPLLDLWHDGDAIPWLRYKYIDGGDLTTIIHARQTLSAEARYDATVADLLHLSDTIGYFHAFVDEHGHPSPIVHRDLKPSNILYCTKTKRLIIADFGIGAVSARRNIAAAAGGMSQGQMVKTYLGGSHTPIYASPQQRGGSRLIDPRDDVHALAVVGYQMMTGQLDSAPGADIEYEFAEQKAPAGFIDLLKQCTARDPNRRPKDGRELHARLAALGKPKPAEVILLEREPVAAPIPVARPVAKPESPSQRVTRLDGEAKAIQDEARAAIRLQDYETAATLMADMRPELVSFRDDALLRTTTQTRDRLRSLHAEIHALLNAHAYRDPKLPKLIADYVAIKPNDGEMNDLARVYPHREPKIGDVITNALGMKFAWVPPGESWLGGGAGKPGTTRFNLPAGLYAGVYQVTQAEYESVTGKNPSYFKGNRHFPVESVLWNDVSNDFLPKLNERCRGDGYEYRLPTADEWEYVCRGGPITKAQSAFDFYFAKSKTDLTPQPTNDLDATMANFDGNYPVGEASKGEFRRKPTKVGLFLPNPLGIYDLHGNVWEWTSSKVDLGQSYRGGSWNGYGRSCAAADRGRSGSSNTDFYLGFRILAVPLSQEE